MLIFIDLILRSDLVVRNLWTVMVMGTKTPMLMTVDAIRETRRRRRMFALRRCALVSRRAIRSRFLRGMEKYSLHLLGARYSALRYPQSASCGLERGGFVSCFCCVSPS